MILVGRLLFNCSSFSLAGSPVPSSHQNLSFIFKPILYPKHHKKSGIFTNTTPKCSNVNISIHKETEEILEWNSICTQISNFASTSVAKAHCKNGRIRIGDNREESEKLLEQTRAVLELPEPLDFGGIDDVTEIVRLAVNSGLLSIGQLCAVERSLKAAKRVCTQLERICCAREEHNRPGPCPRQARQMPRASSRKGATKNRKLSAAIRIKIHRSTLSLSTPLVLTSTLRRASPSPREASARAMDSGGQRRRLLQRCSRFGFNQLLQILLLRTDIDNKNQSFSSV